MCIPQNSAQLCWALRGVSGPGEEWALRGGSETPKSTQSWHQPLLWPWIQGTAVLNWQSWPWANLPSVGFYSLGCSPYGLAGWLSYLKQSLQSKLKCLCTIVHPFLWPQYWSTFIFIHCTNFLCFTRNWQDKKKLPHWQLLGALITCFKWHDSSRKLLE